MTLPIFLQPERVEDLCAAAHSGDANRVKLLLASGKGVANARDSLGFCALHRACVGGSLAAVQALLAGGADVAARDSVSRAGGARTGPRRGAPRRARRRAAAADARSPIANPRS